MEDKFFQINTLMDFYGALLTQKQRRVMSMYYLYDCSLNEIADEFNISKQAVSVNIKRAENNLKNFEKKLQLVSLSKKREDEKKKKNEILTNLFKKFQDNSQGYDKQTLEEIKTVIFE